MIAAQPSDLMPPFSLDRLASLLSLDWLEQAVAVHPLEAGLLMLPLGVAFLLYGFRLYKWLVILVYAFAGGVLGAVAAQYAGVHMLIGMTAGALLMGLVAWPLHRLGLALLGGVGLALAAMMVAAAMGVTSQATLVMIVIGAFIGGTIITAILLRPLIILMMSLNGAVLMVQAALCLAVAWPSFGEPMLGLLRRQPYLFGVAVLVLTAVGCLLQFSDEGGKAGAGKKKRKKEAEEE